MTLEEAAKRLNNGETLMLGTGYEINKKGAKYVFEDGSELGACSFARSVFSVVDKKRYMTKWECLKWACSDDSNGWVVRCKGGGDWFSPHASMYSNPEQMERAQFNERGVLKDTIQDFEVEIGVCKNAGSKD